MSRNNVIKFPGIMHLKVVPSRVRYYIKCPYFLYLSNHNEVFIPYSPVASQKGNYFEKSVLNRISRNTGFEIIKAKKISDLLSANGLYTLNKKVDAEFYADNNARFKIGMLKPDLIMSEITRNSIDLTIVEIKNSDDLQPYHLLQAYIYKLTLQKLLSEEIKMAINIGVRMVHWGKGAYPKAEYEWDFERFKEKIVSTNSESFIVETSLDLESEIVFNQALQKIALIQSNTVECDTCPGADKCKHSLCMQASR